MKTSSGARRFLDNYFDFLLRRRLLFWSIAGALLAVCGFFASKLYLKTSLAELLPQKLESVQNSNEASRRLGGTGTLIIGVQGPHYSKNRAFVEELVKKFDPMVGKSLRYYEYRYTDVQAYLHKYALHYLDDHQLADFDAKLKKEILKHKDQAVGSFLGLNDDAPAPDAKNGDAKNGDAKNGDAKSSDEGLTLEGVDPAFKRFLEYRDAYLSGDDGRIMVISLRPLTPAMSVHDARILRDEVRKLIREVDPKKFDAEIRVELSGNVQQMLEEFDTIREDLFDTGLELAAFIASIIFLFTWSFPVLILLGGVLITAVVYTFGITQLGIGYLNTQTAFMASIIVGTGINYGIIYLGRFRELAKKLTTVEALREALKDTVAPTLIGSSSTAVAFLTLLIADNKGLSQFGFIGAIGVLFCWLVTYSLMPLAIYEYEKRGRRLYPWRNPFANLASKWGGRFGEAVARHWVLGLVVTALVTGAAVFGFLRLVKDPIEYNFDNVRTKLVYDPDFIGFRKRTHSVFPTSLSPAIVFVDNEQQAREICPTVLAIKTSQPADKNMIESCASLYDVIPKAREMTPERIKLLRQVQTTLQDKALGYSDYGESLEAIGKNTVLTPPTEAEIPAQITRRFKELDGRVGLFAMVSPSNTKTLNDGRNLLVFTDSLTDFKLPKTGKVVSAASESFIFADILRGIRHDASLISIVSFVSVILHCILFAGGLRNGLFMGFCLVVCSFWMVGAQGWEGLKYNFFNFIALPLTFGIGIDYPVNVFLPILHDEKRRYGHIFTTSGAAVMLCSLTTFIGYLTLLGAKSQALATFARLSILGEFACLVGALILVPIFLQALNRGRALQTEKLVPKE